MVLALTAVTIVLAGWQARKEGTVRQQLREWCYPAEQKRGDRRQRLDVSACCVPLLRWMLAGYRGTQLALALDATSLGERFVVLTLSVVYRGCAIPVAWRPHWLRLLRQVQPAIPAGMTVMVLADRGLYARWLFHRMRRLGWPPSCAATPRVPSGQRAPVLGGGSPPSCPGPAPCGKEPASPLLHPARLWLAVAVATLWLLLVGGEAEDDLPDSTLLDLLPALALQHRQRQATRLRLVSVFRRDWTLILVALLHHQPLPWGTFAPDPWPPTPDPLQLPLPGLDDDP